MKIFKRIFCGHQNIKFIKDLGGDSAQFLKAQSEWKCEDCGKTIYSGFRGNGDINYMIKRRDIDKSDISDGYHTFGELYDHRMILFSIICNQNESKAWKSWLHDDGTMFDDYFIVGITTKDGDFTYHYHKDHWDMFDVKALDRAPEWDGHTSNDIVRLRNLK